MKNPKTFGMSTADFAKFDHWLTQKIHGICLAAVTEQVLPLFDKVESHLDRSIVSMEQMLARVRHSVESDEALATGPDKPPRRLH